MDSPQSRSTGKYSAPLTHKLIAFTLMGILALQVIEFFSQKSRAQREGTAHPPVRQEVQKSVASEKDSSPFPPDKIVSVTNTVREVSRRSNSFLHPISTSKSGAAQSGSRPSTPSPPERTVILPIRTTDALTLPSPVRDQGQSIRVQAGIPLPGYILVTDKVPQQSRPSTPIKCGTEVINDLLPSFYKVGDGGRIADVVVYVESGPTLDGKTFEVPKEPVDLEISHCLLLPHVVATQVGQSLRILNSDPERHTLRIRDTNRTQVYYKIVSAGAEIQLALTKAGLFQKLEDPIDLWISSWVSAFHHPYFAVTDEKGEFNLPALVEGKHILVVAHRKLGSLRVTLDVRTDGSSSLNGIVLPVPEHLREPTAALQPQPSLSRPEAVALAP